MNYSYLKSKSFGIPSLIWAIYAIAIIILFSIGNSKYLTIPQALTQWDGQHYNTIAYSGYEAFPCPENNSLICGNVGWFPFYPMVGRIVGTVLSFFGAGFRWALPVTSLLSLWGALLLLFSMVEKRYDLRTAIYSITAMLLFPSSFYFATAFPYSLFLLLSLLVFYFLERKYYLLSSIPAGLLSITYPSGIVIALPILWVLLSERKNLTNKNRLSLLISFMSTGFSLLMYSLYNSWRFGDFFLYLHFQQKPYYAHDAAFPMVTIFKSLATFQFGHPVYIMLVFIILAVILFYNKKTLVSWQIFMFGILLFTPTAGTTDCYYRHIVAAFPLFVMIGNSLNSWRRYLLPIYAIASIVLMWFVYLNNFKLGLLM